MYAEQTTTMVVETKSTLVLPHPTQLHRGIQQDAAITEAVGALVQVTKRRAEPKFNELEFDFEGQEEQPSKLEAEKWPSSIIGWCQPRPAGSDDIQCPVR